MSRDAAIHGARLSGARRRSSGALRLLAAVGGVCLVALLFHVFGVVINTTPSLPLGFYARTDSTLVRGALVLVCPSPTPLIAEAQARGYLDAGYCPGGHGYLMKRIWGLPGDAVEVRDEGVWVNGERVPNSTPIAADLAGRALPRYRAELVLPTQQYLVLSEHHARSFDARYFGPIARAQIVAVIRPLLVSNGGM